MMAEEMRNCFLIIVWAIMEKIHFSNIAWIKTGSIN